MQGIIFSTKKIKIKLHAQSNPLAEVQKARYVATGFQAFGDNEKEQDYLRVLTSNNGTHFNRLSVAYPSERVRDPSMVRVGNRWIIIYTDGIMWTSDFKKWQQGTWNIDFQKYSNVWAPCLFLDKTGWNVAVAMSDKQNAGAGFSIHIFKFNVQTCTVENEITTLKLPKTNVIDPQMVYSNGVYNLWYKDEANKQLCFASSRSLFGEFNPIPTNINTFQKNRKMLGASDQKGWFFEAPEFLRVSEKTTRLYFDTYDFTSAANSHYHGMYYANFLESKGSWSIPKPVVSDFIIRHFSVIKQ